MNEDLTRAIEAIPVDTPTSSLPEKLEPLMERIAELDPASAEACLLKIQFRFKLRKVDIEAYRRILRHKEREAKAEAEASSLTTVMTANFEGLVDIAGSDGNVVFLVLDGNQLVALSEMERGGERLIPPRKDGIPWLLPRADEVLRWYRCDSDPSLYDDLLLYHRSISELPSDAHYDLLAAWDFHTYLIDAAQYSPYIWLFGVPERGKSRTGKGMIYVAYRGLHVESLREAYLLRAGQDLRASLFMDVMDLWRKAEKSGSEDILLQRFEKGAKVPRVLYPEKGPHQDTVYYDLFGATIIGTNEPVHHILETRAILLTLPQSQRTYENEVTPELGRPFRERLVALRARHLGRDLPPMNKPARGRLGDILKPLLQVVQLVRPERMEVMLDLVGEIQRSRMVEKSTSLEGEILLAVQNLEPEAVDGILTVQRIVDVLNDARGERNKVTSQKIGRRLSALGFEKTRTRLNCAAIVWDPEHLGRVMPTYGLQETPLIPETPGPLSPNDLQAGVSSGESGDSGETLQAVTPCGTTDLESAGVSGVSGSLLGDDFPHLTQAWGEGDWEDFVEQSGKLLEAGLTKGDADWQAMEIVNLRRGGRA